MMHHNLEHRRHAPEPFTIRGTLKVILKYFGMPEDMNYSAAEDVFCESKPMYCKSIDKTCTIIEWECDTEYDGLPIYMVKATPIHLTEQMPEPDPWVVVGRTTIDGTYADINRMFGVDAVGKTTNLGPTMVGGRMLVATGWHLNKALGGEALVFCDIIRRQSEIDAELAAEVEAGLASVADQQVLIGPCDEHGRCPECGPHGNAGRVLLLETMVDCTTCRRPSTCQSGQCTGREEDGWCPQCDQASIDSMSTEMADVDKAMTDLAFVKTGVDEDGRTVWKKLVGAPEDAFSIPSTASTEAPLEWADNTDTKHQFVKFQFANLRG